MHYYQHNIGDYRRDTSHLSLLEHGIYRQLMDWYYLEETPIPKETNVVFRRVQARTEEETKAVISVLTDFFTLTENGYIQTRCDEEIRAYHVKAETARANGKAGGRPSKTKPVSDRNQRKTNAKPSRKLTNKPINSGTNSSPSPEAQEDERLARWMFDHIVQVLPESKEPNFTKWANTIRLMRERDHLSHRRIAEVFSYANNDVFWKTNILSPDKLREKFAQLAAKRDQAVQNAAPAQSLTDKLNDRSWAEEDANA